VIRDVRDRQQKNYTLPGPGPKEKLHRDQNRNRDQRLNLRLYDGLNSVNFCTSEVTLFGKKEPKSASRRLNKLKKRVLKNFLDEILNYRSAGPLSVPATGTKKLNFTGTKRKTLAGPEPGPGPNKKSYRDWDRDRDQKKLVPHISNCDYSSRLKHR
jgi:hypothetical protein